MEKDVARVMEALEDSVAKDSCCGNSKQNIDGKNRDMAVAFTLSKVFTCLKNLYIT